jgi:hypothetical protein
MLFAEVNAADVPLTEVPADRQISVAGLPPTPTDAFP